MKHELDKLSYYINKVKLLELNSNKLSKNTYFSVLASLESIEPTYVQEEIPTGTILDKVAKLNGMLNNRAVNTLLSTLDYVIPLITEYLKEIPEQFNPDTYQLIKERISQSFKTLPIKPFHTLSDNQRENILNTIKKHFDLSDIPSIDLVNVLIDGYNAGAPKLNIARQTNINFVVKQEYDIKEVDQKILDLELIHFIKHRVRELFLLVDELKFDGSMEIGELESIIREYLSNSDKEKIIKLKEIISNSSIIASVSLESQDVPVDKIHILPISSDILNCAKEIYSPGLKEIITKIANTGNTNPFSELTNETIPSISYNNTLGEYVEFLDEVNIITASLGLLAKVLKTNAHILTVATKTMQELDVKFDELYKELIEISNTEDTSSNEAFGWIKKLFGFKVKKLNIDIKQLPENLNDLIELEERILSEIQYIEQQNTGNFDKNKDRFIATVEEVIEEFTGVNPQLKNKDTVTLETWIKQDFLNLNSKEVYYESLFKLNKQYLLKLGEQSDALDLLTRQINSILNEFNNNVNNIIPISKYLKEIYTRINVFGKKVEVHELENFYNRYFSEKGEAISFNFNDAREICKNNREFFHNANTIRSLSQLFSEQVYNPVDKINNEWKIDDISDLESVSYEVNVINDCLYMVTESMKGLFAIETFYGVYVFVMLAYLESLKG